MNAKSPKTAPKTKRKRMTAEEAEARRRALRDDVLEAGLGHVPFDGWTRKAFERGCKDLGEVPETVRVVENGVAFDVSPREGHKTGWYYDHRENRAWIAAKLAGARVLDLFSYAGGFGIQAAVGGAASVLCVDSAESG